jgi:hypothetical protein
MPTNSISSQRREVLDLIVSIILLGMPKTYLTFHGIWKTPLQTSHASCYNGGSPRNALAPLQGERL